MKGEASRANAEIAQIQACASDLGTTLSEQQATLLQGYLDLLEKWNRVYNLTAVRSREQMLIQHVFDCLAVLRPLTEQHPEGGTLIDVGSGAGLPAVVIAVCRPDLDVVSVDAVDKKARFVGQVAAELRIPNLKALHQRIEEVSLRADIVSARAFSSLGDLISLTENLLDRHGMWIAMKGKFPSSELSALPPTVEAFHVEQLTVPALNAERCLVWLRKVAPPLP